MSNSLTIARPYAKAAFNFSIEKKNIECWQKMLEFAAKITYDKKIYQILTNIVMQEISTKIFISICENHLDKYAINFIKIMAEKRRLLILPEVVKHFITLRSSWESIIKVEVFSAKILTKKQKDMLILMIEKRFQCKVKLNCKIDHFLLSGIIIRIKNTVMNDSIRNRLLRMSDILQS
ncbi:ATP synthase subunit delta [Serratia symbiotica]|nr:ATP synthase subunit delta [Serratia symbiotica]